MAEMIKAGFEQHLQTVLTTVIIAAILWTGNKIVDYQSRLIRVEEQLLAMNKKLDIITSMRATIDDLRVRVIMLERDRDSARFADKNNGS